jgi:hypothetical protein
MVESGNFPVMNAAQGAYGGVRDGVLVNFGP